MKPMYKFRVWMTGVLLLVVVSTHVSYGEVTVLHHRRINWWSGQVSFMWGQRSGASGRLLSFDEFHLNPPAFQRGLKMPSIVPGRVGGPAWGFALLPLLMIWLAVYYRQAGRQPEACRRCGYLFVGRTRQKCPECGELIRRYD